MTLNVEECNIKESQTALKHELADAEYRQAYAEDFLNTWVATQIVTLREQRGLSQARLAELIGTKQPGVSRLEDVNHSKWKTDTLKRIARALGVRLKITFETFGDLLIDDERFCREYLKRPEFKDDPEFKDTSAEEQTRRPPNGFNKKGASLLGRKGNLPSHPPYLVGRNAPALDYGLLGAGGNGGQSQNEII